MNTAQTRFNKIIADGLIERRSNLPVIRTGYEKVIAMAIDSLKATLMECYCDRRAKHA